MGALTFYCPTNRKGKRDGDEFKREARAFNARYGGHLVELEGPARVRRATFTDACVTLVGENIGKVAYFGHGTPKGLVHIYGLKTVGEMASALALCCSPGVTVALYACLVGQGFAGALCDELHKTGVAGARVWGHHSAGHTTRNPTATLDPPGGQLFDRRSIYWKPWREALKSEFRFDFPWRSRREIELYLRHEDRVVIRPAGPPSGLPEP